MEKRTFFVVSVSHLSNDNVYSLFKSTADIAIPMRGVLGDMINAVLDVFLPNVQTFGEQVNAQRKSQLTEQVTAMHLQNDILLAEIKRVVAFMSKSREADKRAAAKDFDFFFAPFKGNIRKPIKPQVDSLTDMFVKYRANPELARFAQVIGVDVVLSELEVNNTGLSAIYLDRTEEDGARPASGSDLRPAAAESYAQLCNVVETAVNFLPNDTNIKLFNSMDELRRKFAPLASGGKDKPADEAK